MERRLGARPHDRDHQPGRFELFFRDVADLAATGETGTAPFIALADAHGLQLAQPDWQADVIRRYGLTPPSW